MLDDYRGVQQTDYLNVGFDSFLQRSIDGPAPATLAGDLPGQQLSRAVSFDQIQTSGAIGDSIQIGSVTLDGANGKISVYDTEGNEIARLGEL